jgi:steroid delta-isomerase-like uncharacterized protein
MKRMNWIGAAAAIALAVSPACKKDDAAAPAKKDDKKPVDPKKPDTKTPDTKTPDTKTPDTQASSGNPLVDRLMECQGFADKKDWTSLEGCYTDDAKGALSDMPGMQYTGPKDIVAKMIQDFHAAWSDVVIEPQIGLVNGNHFVGVAIFHGTNTGAMGGMPATNKKVGVLALRDTDWDASGKKMSRDLHVVDFGTVMSQLGVSPRPGRPVMDKGDAMKLVVATNSPDEAKNVDVVKKVCDAWMKKDPKAFEAVLADDVVMTDVSMPADMQGKDKFVGVMKAVTTMFPDMKGDCTTTWGAGDYVYNSVDWTGTNTGAAPEFGLAKPTGKKVSLHDAEVYQLKDGKVVHYWRFANSLSMAMQMGLVPGMDAKGGDKDGDEGKEGDKNGGKTPEKSEDKKPDTK